jgi:hypothetical protein
MKKQLRFIFLLFILSGLVPLRLQAQTFGSEAELKEQAAKLFDDDQFEEAYPLYAQLASIYNKDPNINYRLGVCMLYASEDKEKPIPFLEMASAYPDVEKEVFFYLAKAYHLNYRFDDAIKKYQAYEKIASGPKAEKLQVQHQIEMCKNGKRLLRNISDLIVIDKKEMSRADFYRSYDITAIGGKLLAKPDEETFKTPIDKKKKESSIIYFSSDNNQIYFASYGDDASHGKDIYMVRKLPNGELSKPQTLGYPVNTEYDEDFPFLHPNGKVLYFCSKGHNSMGGYDIFKTTLNELTNTWNKPVNLDFPINSPDDDILYITNADEKEAYFSSARSSATGKTAVYHINVERKPLDIAIISGTVIKNTPDQDMNVKITVKDLEDNTILGIFNSKPENGNFTMNLPKGGKVMYTVETPGFPTQSEVVTIPAQGGNLKQELSFEPGTGKLSVNNKFEEAGNDENYLSAINLIKEKSKMEVNVNDVAVDNTTKPGNTGDETTGEKSPGGTKKPANLSNDEIVKIAYNDAKDVEKEAKELKDQAAIALVIANQRNDEAQSKSREVAQLTSEVNQTADNVKKQAVVERLNTASKELSDLNQLTVTSYNVSKALELKADAKQKEADMSMQYAKDLEAAVKSKSSKEALAKLDEQQKQLETISQKNDESATIATSLKLDAENKKKELDKAIQTSTDIKQEITDNEAAIATTESDMAKEKNDNIKKGMQDQIQGLRDDIVSGKKELQANEVKVSQLQKEYDGINNQIEIFNSVVDKAKTGNNDGVNATAAAIDKTKLEQQVNNLKNADNTLASIKPITTDGASQTTSTGKTPSSDVAKNNDAKNPPASEQDTETKTTEPVTKTEIKTEQTVTQTEPEKITTPLVVNDKAVEPAVTEVQDKTFEDALVAAEGIADKTEKETKKAEVYENWHTAVEKELTSKKEAVQTEQDPEKKNALTSRIAILEKKLEETQQSRTTALAAAESARKESELATNTRPESTTDNQENKTVTTAPDQVGQTPTTDSAHQTQIPSADRKDVADNVVKPGETPEQGVSASAEVTKQMEAFEQVYKQEVADAELAPTEEEKETKKLKAAKNYVNSVTLMVNSKKSDLKTESDQSKQQDLNKAIAMMESRIAEKQKVADDSSTKIASAKNAGKTDEQASTVKKENADGAVSKSETVPPLKNIVDTQKAFTYSNTTAKTNLDKAASLDKEADDLLTESKKLKEQAGLQNDVNEKNNLFAKSEELRISAESKKLESAQIIGTANTIEYRNNQHAIDQYINANKGSADELAIADLMKDDAKSYFEKAQSSRKAASSFETYYAKQTALEDAVKNEQVALQKQNNALAVLKKNNPKLVVKPLPATALLTTPPKDKETSTSTEDKSIAINSGVKNVKPEANEGKEKTTTTEQPGKTETPITTPPVTTSETKESIKENVTEKKAVSDVDVNKDKPIADKTIKTEQPVTENPVTTPGKEKTETPVKENGKEAGSDVAKTTEQPGATTKNKTVATIPNEASKTKTKFSLRELFEKRGKSRYSASNPIPMDEKLPDGLVFKVQMGAFKNPIPQDLFKGITPVTGQTTSQGFIRYSAGLFLTCESAEQAKREIRSLGFPDAFVVAFFDGKRIPPPCSTDGTTIAATSTSATPAEETPVTPPVKTETESKPDVTKTETVATPAGKLVTTDVSTLSGLFYTIQVGVYSRPITADELNNIQPLYTENANNNLVRYNVGVYNNIPQASEAKKIAVNGGLKDAFMTIYYNGKRISMAEAATLSAQGITPITSAPGLNQLPTFKSGGGIQTNVPVKLPTVNNGTDTPRNPATATEKQNSTQIPVTPKPATQVAEPETGIVFKVQIGAFNEEVPLDIANKFLRISKKGIKNYKDEKGLTIYTVGKYSTYEEADKSRQEVAGEGLPDAFVVAFSDGRKISVEEAQKLTGKK